MACCSGTQLALFQHAELPFELRCLEAALETALSVMAAETGALELHTSPLFNRASQKVSLERHQHQLSVEACKLQRTPLCGCAIEKAAPPFASQSCANRNVTVQLSICAVNSVSQIAFTTAGRAG
jgi:hypothetical protein